MSSPGVRLANCLSYRTLKVRTLTFYGNSSSVSFSTLPSPPKCLSQNISLWRYPSRCSTNGNYTEQHAYLSRFSHSRNVFRCCSSWNSRQSTASHITAAYKSDHEDYHASKIDDEFVESPATDQYISDTALVSPANDYDAVLTARPDEFDKLPPKCSSCGIILQTHSENQRGFVPLKKFMESVQNETLYKLSCYACFNLRYYSKLVFKRQSNDDVLQHLRHIERKKALILYLVDMFDIEGSLFTDILKVVGEKKRVIIVGTKADRIPQDTAKAPVQLERMKDSLKVICMRNGLDGCNFRDICIVSAKTGYGMHTLVSKINKHRDAAMDIYLVGTSNVGKSTLFNLLQNALNVYKNVQMPGQALSHHYPGTTHSLLREDIGLRKLKKLEWRLKHGPWEVDETYDFDDEIYNMLGVEKEEIVPNLKRRDLQVMGKRPTELKPMDLEFIDPQQKEIRATHLYDTPGILHETQILRHLTPKEINYLAPDKWIVPRTFLLKPSKCLFIGGLARLDFNKIERPLTTDDGEEIHHDQGAESIFVTLFCSPNVPGHITVMETANEKYEKLFGTEIFKIPIGEEGRREAFPDLKPADYVVYGENRNTSSADIVLHGVGWLAVAAVKDSQVHLTLHTPNGVGQGIRRPSLLPYSVRQKGKRGKHYQGRPNPNLYTHTRKRSPQLIRVFQKQTEPVQGWQQQIKKKLKAEVLDAKEKVRAQRLASGEVYGRMKNILKAEQAYSGLLEEVKEAESN